MVLLSGFVVFNSLSLPFQPIADDIAHHTSAFEHVMKKGEELLETRAPGKEKKVLRKRLDDLEKRWNDVTAQSSTRETQIEKVLGLVDEYNNMNKEFLTWLSEEEKKLETTLEPALDQDAVEKQQELLEVRPGSESSLEGLTLQNTTYVPCGSQESFCLT